MGTFETAPPGRDGHCGGTINLTQGGPQAAGSPGSGEPARPPRNGPGLPVPTDAPGVRRDKDHSGEHTMSNDTEGTPGDEEARRGVEEIGQVLKSTPAPAGRPV